MGRQRDGLVSPRLGITRSDVLIGVAAACLVGALAYPALRGRAFRGLVGGVVMEVEALRSGATRSYTANGGWPASTEPGAMPAGMTGSFEGDTTLVREDYSLQWSVWEVVEETEIPSNVSVIPAETDARPDSVGPPTMTAVRQIGSVVVHSGRDDLLAELLIRYGAEISFVRDTTWTLVVPRPDGS